MRWIWIGFCVVIGAALAYFALIFGFVALLMFIG